MKYVIILLLLTGCVGFIEANHGAEAANPRFGFGDQVVITKGFYKLCRGQITSGTHYNGGIYHVKGNCVGLAFNEFFSSHELRAEK